MIRSDDRNPDARMIRDRLLTHFPGGVDGDDFVVVIGGDGFLLRTVAELGTGPTYFGLNAGHLGFLLNDVTAWDTLVRHLHDRDLREHRFPLLHASITTAEGHILDDRGINDVYLERASGQTARLTVRVDGEPIVDPLVADGIVFATALGSTAYSFSAGGMACHPELSILAVTPICPHHPRLHPFALPATVRAEVEVQQPQRRPVRVVVDGRTFSEVTRVSIGYQDEYVRLAYLPDRDFTTRMIRKILRP